MALSIENFFKNPLPLKDYSVFHKACNFHHCSRNNPSTGTGKSAESTFIFYSGDTGHLPTKKVTNIHTIRVWLIIDGIHAKVLSLYDLSEGISLKHTN